MTQPLPTIVFFAGAFADPSCFDTLSSLFREAGYPTNYAYVSTLNPSNATIVSTSKDAEEARNKYILPLLEDGKDVVVLVHSYGGVVGGQAAAGLSKKSRSAAGKAGGVIGLIYLAGNIVGEGETLLQAVGGAYPPFIKQNYVSSLYNIRRKGLNTHYPGNSPPKDLQSLILSWTLYMEMSTPI
jgi:rhodanese-related sulfurtransferase